MEPRRARDDMSDPDMSSPASSGATTPSDGSWVDVASAASAGAEGDEPPTTTTTRVSAGPRKARGDDDGDASADAGGAGAGFERGSSRPLAKSNPGPRNTPDISDAVAALRRCAARHLRALAERLEHSDDEDEDEEKDEDEDRLAKKLARVARSLAADIARRVARAVAEAYVACRLGFARHLCPRSERSGTAGEGWGVASRPRRRPRQLCAPPWNVIAPILVGLLVGLAWKRACAGGANQPPPPPNCGL